MSEEETAATTTDESVVDINTDDADIAAEPQTSVGREATPAERDLACLLEAQAIKQDAARFSAARALSPVHIQG